jgi:hypothetical protein
MFAMACGAELYARADPGIRAAKRGRAPSDNLRHAFRDLDGKNEGVQQQGAHLHVSVLVTDAGADIRGLMHCLGCRAL